MGMDDDADCVEHVFGVAEVHLTVGGAEMVRRCERCPAVAYVEDRPATNPRRPRL